MSKKSKLGTCALCKSENVKLSNSHIIPRLVYKRVAEFENTPFRNFYNLHEIYQNGLSKPMLCSNCEKEFNKYETIFANYFLDNFIKSKVLPEANLDIIRYIAIVSWRVLYYQLYFEKRTLNKIEKAIYLDLEKILRSSITGTVTENFLGFEKEIENYLIPIERIIDIPELVDFLGNNIVFGTYSSKNYKKSIIFTSYLGIIIVLSFSSNRYIEINKNIRLRDVLINRRESKNIRIMIGNAFAEEFRRMLGQLPINDEQIKNGLSKKKRKIKHI